MRFSDSKAKTTVHEAPRYQVPVPDSTVPEPTHYEKEHELGVRMKEGMMEKYRMVGGDVITPYFFIGTQLIFPAMLETMEHSNEVQRSHQCMDGWQSTRCTEFP